MKFKIPSLLISSALIALFIFGEKNEYRDTGIGIMMCILPLTVIFFPKPFAMLTGCAVGGGFIEGDLPIGLVIFFGYALLVASPLAYYSLT